MAVVVYFIAFLPVVLSFNVESGVFRDVTLPQNNVNSSRFFGTYFEIEFRLTKMMVTCPGCVSNPYNSSLDGRLYRCSLQSNNPCEDVSPEVPPLMQMDAFGLDITSPARRSFVACSSLRSTICSGTVQQLGHCYVGQLYGRIWDQSLTKSFVCPHSHVDILFLLDGSSSINHGGVDNFKTVKEWVKNVTEKFDISSGGSASVGVVQYSTWLPQFGFRLVVTEIKIGKYTVFDDFANAVDNIVLHSGTTFTGSAIPIAAGAFSNSSNFGDPFTKKVLILLTDGVSNDPQLLNSSSLYLKSQNITAFSVGVRAADLTELQIVANGRVGDNERVYQLSDFSKLDSIVQSIFTEISGIILEAGDNNATNELKFSQTGFSTAFDSDRKMYLEIGVYDKGTKTR